MEGSDAAAMAKIKGIPQSLNFMDLAKVTTHKKHGLYRKCRWKCLNVGGDVCLL